MRKHNEGINCVTFLIYHLNALISSIWEGLSLQRCSWPLKISSNLISTLTWLAAASMSEKKPTQQKTGTKGVKISLKRISSAPESHNTLQYSKHVSRVSLTPFSSTSYLALTLLHTEYQHVTCALWLLSFQIHTYCTASFPLAWDLLLQKNHFTVRPDTRLQSLYVTRGRIS